MKVFDSWAVAAAILLGDNEDIHYADIADLVVGTGLTTLGLKGDTPPSQTIGSIMRTTEVRGERVFVRQCPGYYKLRDKEITRSYPEVVAVLLQLAALRELQKMNQAADERARTLEERIARLQKEKKELRGRLKKIAHMCER